MTASTHWHYIFSCFRCKAIIMNIWNRQTRIPEIYGTLIFLGLLVYFFISYAAGLIHVIELRFLNLLIMLAGVYYALKQFRRTHEGHLNYFRALTVGTVTAVIGTSTFSVFLFIFLKIDPAMMETIREAQHLGRFLDPYMASFAVFYEGIFSGFGLTYLLANYMRTSEVSDPVGESQ
jgi:uncharacterized membrane protein